MKDDNELMDRISIDPNVMVGKPVIKGTRLTVAFILQRLAHGTSQAALLDEYEGLSPLDIQACLLYASRFLSEQSRNAKAAG